MEDIRKFRQDFPITRNKIYLNHAAHSPLPRPVTDAMQRHIEEFSEYGEPPFIGWASVKPEVFETIDFWEMRDLKLSETASRFEIGTPSRVSATGAVAALHLLLDVGIENIEKRILKLTDHLIERLSTRGIKFQTPLEPECRSGIVNFLIDNPQERTDKLAKKNIIVSARSHGIRVSPHFYNTEEEIDKLVEEATE